MVEKEADVDPPYVYECFKCGTRVEADGRVAECPDCGGRMDNLSKPRT